MSSAALRLTQYESILEMATCKIICLLLLSVSITQAFPKAFELIYVADLDGQGQFVMNWGFKDGTGDIEIQLQANCTGWLSISIVAPDGNLEDILVVGYDDVAGTGYVEDRYSAFLNPIVGGTLDDSPDVVLKGAVYHEPWTIARFSRSVNTGDLQDVILWVALHLFIFQLNSYIVLTASIFFQGGSDESRLGLFIIRRNE